MATDYHSYYSWRGGDVMRNKLGIRQDAELLKARTALIAAWRYGELLQENRPPATSVLEYQKLHQHLYQDVHVWAGRLRIADVPAEEGAFPPAHFVSHRLEQVFAALPDEAARKAMPDMAFAGMLAGHLAGLDAIQPFRQGNDALLRLQAQLLARQAKRALSWKDVTARDWQQAMQERDDPARLRPLLLRALAIEPESILDAALALQRGPGGLALPPPMAALLPATTRRSMTLAQASAQLQRYLPTARTMAEHQLTELASLEAPTPDMQLLTRRAAQELAFLKDEKGPAAHLHVLEQRRLIRLHVLWGEEPDPLQRVRAIAEASAKAIARIPERELTKALITVDQQGGPELAARFRDNGAADNRADPVLAPWQQFIDDRIRQGVEEGIDRRQLTKLAEQLKHAAVVAISKGESVAQLKARAREAQMTPAR